MNKQACEIRDGETLRVDLWYPDFTKPLEDQPRVEIDLVHVRAADKITVYFDGPRNGYVVLMDKTRDGDGYMEVLQENAEVAFIPAWNEQT